MKIRLLIIRVLIAFSISSLAFSSFAGVGEGQELYNSFCTICHGPIGEGQAMGKPLTDGMANRLSDEDLLTVITEGRSGTGMAGWGDSFSDEEIFDMATYVRALQGKPGLNLADDNVGISDDPAILAGEEVFNGAAGCVNCHTYRDQGGSVGPVLDGLSGRLPVAALIEALLNPSASIVSGFGAKIVEQEDGTQIVGRFRNDSELAVQLQSGDGKRWVTFFKDRVRLITDSTESLMPDVYISLSAAEQQQLLAFLNSL
jgi:putative heme-binding domain-containing protein